MAEKGAMTSPSYGLMMPVSAGTEPGTLGRDRVGVRGGGRVSVRVRVSGLRLAGHLGLRDEAEEAEHCEGLG